MILMATLVQLRRQQASVVQKPAFGSKATTLQTQHAPSVTTETAIKQTQSLEIVQTLMLTSVRRQAADAMMLTH